MNVVNVKSLVGIAPLFLWAAAIVAAPPALAQDLGPVDMVKFCEAPENRGSVSGLLTLKRDPANPYSWLCVFAPADPTAGSPTLIPVNMNQVCAQQYGKGAWAYMDPDTSYAWRCYR